MTTQNSNIFDRLTEHRGAPAEMLDEMVSHFRDTRSPMELFEALKMRIRDKLGLPLVSNDNEPSRPEDVERQLEVGLLDACRETGTMLLEDGRIGEG